jgi:hypothetical protein
MPTGYTNQLEEMRYDVRRWLKEGIVRGMCLCAGLRDSGDMTEDQILKSLSGKNADGGDSSYHSTQIAMANRRISRLSGSEKELRAEFDRKKDKAYREYDKSLKAWEGKKASHQRSLVEVNKLISKSKKAGIKGDTVTAGVLEFAKEQLERVLQSDYGTPPWREGIMDMDFRGWIREERNSATHDIEYHTKERAKSSAMKSDNSAMYREFVEFVNSAE